MPGVYTPMNVPVRNTKVTQLSCISKQKSEKEIEELQLAGWKYRALKATLPANNANVIWLERNVWAGNEDGIRHCQQFVINYEDSIRHRYEMEQEAIMRDSIGRLMIRQSQDIKKKLK